MSKFGNSVQISGSISKLNNISGTGASSFAELSDSYLDSNNYIVVNNVKYTKYTDYLELRNRIELIEAFIQAHFENQ
jgi:hypothetical protein